ncbi:MAG: hypothetical protein JXA13_10585 [Anaerolineales bacterium]|nr:hypothetical protein [Anaerolineales bacterium]
MKKITIYQITTILATLITLTINGLANALPLNGQGTGEISDRFAIYFVPAGYVFSIWGLIYIGLIAFTIYQALPAQRDNALLKKISPAYWVGSLANSVWIFLWHYEFFPLTLIAMLVLLASLLYTYLQLPKASPGKLDNLSWFVWLPFSVYLGWISVATIANVSQVLFAAGWNGWGLLPEAWAVIMLVVATLLGLLMQWRENNIPYVLVLIWAFAGIAVSQAGTAPVTNTAWVTAALLALAVITVPALKKILRKGKS